MDGWALRAIADVPTTVTVKGSTLARLRAYKTPGATLDGVLNDLRAGTPPESSGPEIERRRAEPGPNVPANVMLRRLREQVLRRA